MISDGNSGGTARTYWKYQSEQIDSGCAKMEGMPYKNRFTKCGRSLELASEVTNMDKDLINRGIHEYIRIVFFLNGKAEYRDLAPGLSTLDLINKELR
ncbi:MAG TPA: hypothetical protein PLI73_03415, partial [Candidatus Cloacimonadota bacterium]|nr:hypothetical protein [Candidatus Cloacimonadota bacterium]